VRRPGRCPAAASRSTSVPVSIAGTSPGSGRVASWRLLPTGLDQASPRVPKRWHLPSSPCRGAADADIAGRCPAGRRMRKSQMEATMSLIEASGDSRMTCSAELLRYGLRRLAPTTMRADLPDAAVGPSALLAGTVERLLFGRRPQPVRRPLPRSWAGLPPHFTPSGHCGRSDGPRERRRRDRPDHVWHQGRSVGPSSTPPRQPLIGPARDELLPRAAPPTGSEQGSAHP
jgi:hypothetical protein